MEQLQRLSGSGVQGVAFLLNGVNEVIQSRRLLQWSYVLGFYLIDGSDVKGLFELHQKNLETFTEQLSQMTEQPLEQLAAVPARRTEVINLTRVLKKVKSSSIPFHSTHSLPVRAVGLIRSVVWCVRCVVSW